jgi:hypothetical protein
MPMMLVYPLVLAAQLTLVSDGVPRFDIGPTCRTAADGVLAGRTEESCRKDEAAAQKELDGKWKNFNGADQARCTSLVHQGGPPSYVELLTCLELAQQVKQIRESKGGDVKP